MATISVEGKNEALDALLANVNSGTLRIYTGAAPADPTDAATGTLLAEIALANPAFSAATGGVATLAASTAEDAAPASGTGGYGRLAKSDNTGVIDLTVAGSVRTGASDSAGDLLLTTTAAHGLANDTAVRFFVEAGGALPSNLSATTIYYVKSTASLTFKVGTSVAGAPLAFTNAGTPSFRASPVSDLALSTVDGSVTMGVAVAVANLTMSIN